MLRVARSLTDIQLERLGQSSRPAYCTPCDATGSSEGSSPYASVADRASRSLSKPPGEALGTGL